MLNICTFVRNSSAIKNLESSDATIADIFSPELLERIQVVHSKRTDNVVIRGLPTVEDLENTPKEIHGTVPDIFPKYLIEILRKSLGEFSEKGIENSIRFPASSDGSTNVETSHGHPQFSYSVFYCLRGDENAKTYFLSANDVIGDASEEMRQILLGSSLIRQIEGGYKFSEEIYHPSDFQQSVKNLDLPDTTKVLNGNREDDAYKYLLMLMAGTNDLVVYKPGDIAIYNERATMRFSPSYTPSTDVGKERWLLGIGVH